MTHATDDPTAHAIKARLRGVSLRATASRVAVLDMLVRHQGPISHAELTEALSQQGLDRATLYRNLIDLTRVGLVSRRDLGDHVWRFELMRPAHSEADEGHPHFICTGCGEVRCLPEVRVEIIGQQDTLPSLQDAGIEVHLRGRCEAC